ncbi:uncharacterized protein LOC111615136 isoform X1 [Centruroides sculpturatus]|uniref:uncharacterized protein LOC111615136 isoform X1 n=1 Tax=Centruroides sculpturatus TaxID=218467 RepID=UPI000C6EEDAD|nr:uncharacterized protein LOC111615136 isoform X1 [Centruroides sculpturatus]
MNRLFIVLTFVGIVSLYNFQGDAALIDDLRQIIQNTVDVIEAIKTLEAHLKTSNPDKSLLTKDIKQITDLIDKLNGSPFEKLKHHFKSQLKDLKSGINSSSSKKFEKAVANTLKSVSSFLEKKVK